MDSGLRSHRRGASARLRKTFRYPSEDEANDENALEVMDEQGMCLSCFCLLLLSPVKSFVASENPRSVFFVNLPIH